MKSVVASKYAPRFEAALYLLAKYPSKKSVKASSRNKAAPLSNIPSLTRMISSGTFQGVKQ